MSNHQLKAYKNYKWLVKDPEYLGGALAIKGTRLSVSLILECLAADMTVEDINESFGGVFPAESMNEIFTVASEMTGPAHVA